MPEDEWSAHKAKQDRFDDRGAKLSVALEQIWSWVREANRDWNLMDRIEGYRKKGK